MTDSTADSSRGDGLSSGGIDAGVLLAYQSERPTTRGFELGPDARVRSGSVLYDGTRIGARLNAGHHVVIREGCVIGDDFSIWSGSVVDYGCWIGNAVRVHCNCYLAQYSRIEDCAFLAPGVVFANDLYPGVPDSAQRMTGPVVGAHAQIGVNVTILPYVRIGEGSIIGAGSVVTRDVPAGSVAYGAPSVVHGRVVDLVPIESRVIADLGSPSGFRRVDAPPDGTGR